jgi:hypothetical protein|tara:strand:+ start:6660 stop:7211 length:552 start_codon:yes stop_codon:yes gene_type:complete
MSRVVDSLIAYRILRMFAQPIKKHPAYQMGIVDADGNKIKEPSGSQELDAYTLLDKLAFKIKRALMKSPDRTAKRLLTFAAAIALLRESKDDVEEMEDGEFEALLDLYSEDENVIKESKMLEMGRTPFTYFALDEEIANVAGPMGGGAIAGIGTGAQGEPGRNPSLMPLQRRKKKRQVNGKSN